MRRLLGIVGFAAFHWGLSAQIGLQTNLPKALALNSEVTFEVKIKKGSTANFAKYQMEIPREMTIKEVDIKGGSFTFEDNAVKIIWAMVPAEPEITVSLKLTTGLATGKKQIVQKYFYVENDDKKQVEMEPITITVKDSTSAEPFVSTSEFTESAPKTAPSVLTTTINAAEIGTKNPALLIQQVLQLRKDSRDAKAVGEREKKKAEDKLAEANDAIAKAEALTDENEKKAALEKANQSKQRALNDLEVAERVLILAKSLEDNANEIDAINKRVNPDSYAKDPKDPLIASNNTPKKTSADSKETSTTIDLDEPEETERSSPGKSSSKKKSESGSGKEAGSTKETSGGKEGSAGKEAGAAGKDVEPGLVYKLQLGAFSKEPSKRDFKSVGKVKIAEENGMYKVLYGSYASKEEALKQREQILSKGFDAFVVAYENGVRVFK